MKAKHLIHTLLVTNTGKHFLDSGGAYGRHWEKNQGLSLEDFENSPSAYLEIYRWERDGKVSYDFSPTISLFHHLTQSLECDEICEDFNALPVADWGSEFYGVSEEGEEWLKGRGFSPEGDAFNSYNWSANFTQTIQGQFLDLDGEKYCLLQIHGGCDVRGGYTDAKLFKIKSGETYSVLMEDCGFCVETPDGESLSLTWTGSEWINSEGTTPTDEEFERFALAAGVSEDNHRVVIHGDCFVCY